MENCISLKNTNERWKTWKNVKNVIVSFSIRKYFHSWKRKEQQQILPWYKWIALKQQTKWRQHESRANGLRKFDVESLQIRQENARRDKWRSVKRSETKWDKVEITWHRRSEITRNCGYARPFSTTASRITTLDY